MKIKEILESATAGATSSASIATVPNPHLSPGKARGKKSYTGSPWTGSGTKSPPQPKPKKQKPTDNALDMKTSLFGEGNLFRRQDVAEADLVVRGFGGPAPKVGDWIKGKIDTPYEGRLGQIEKIDPARNVMRMGPEAEVWWKSAARSEWVPVKWLAKIGGSRFAEGVDQDVDTVVVYDTKGKVLDRLDVNTAAQKYGFSAQDIKNQLRTQDNTTLRGTKGQFTVGKPMVNKTESEDFQGVAEGSITKSIKRGLQGWGSPQDKPADIVKRNKAYDDETVQRLRKAATGTGQGDYNGKDKHSPAGLQKRVLDREIRKRGLDKEGVAEAERNEMDTPEFQRALASVKKSAAQGPKKTVYDPKTGKYKVVPVNDKKEGAYESKLIDKLNKLVENLDSAEYNDEAGMAENNLHTLARAVEGLLDTIKGNDNLPEWVQEKIAKAEMILVTVWDYLLSQKEQGIDPEIT